MKTFIILAFIVLGTIITSCKSNRQVPAELEVYAPVSEFVFQGTVKVIHTSTIDAVNAEPLGVVHVTHIYKSFDPMDDIVGKDITVNFKNIKSVNPGERYVFFCDPYFIGNEIAVSEIGRMNIVDLDEEKLGEQIVQVTQEYNDEKLRERVQKSEVVVTGSILSIKKLLKERNIDSEHDPEWAEATLQIESTFKGDVKTTVTFLFPTSSDVAWAKSPKFKEGDTGVFLLRTSPVYKELDGRYLLTEKKDYYIEKETIDKIKSFSK